MPLQQSKSLIGEVISKAPIKRSRKTQTKKEAPTKKMPKKRMTDKKTKRVKKTMKTIKGKK